MLEAQPVVFLLDDEEAVVVALGRMLQASGFNIRAWTSGAEFLNAHVSVPIGDGDHPPVLSCSWQTARLKTQRFGVKILRG